MDNEFDIAHGTILSSQDLTQVHGSLEVSFVSSPGTFFAADEGPWLAC